MATRDNLEAILAFVRENAEALHLSKLPLLELAVEEAVSNVINYSGSQEIEITCSPSDSSGIEIMIRDWGVAYDPLVEYSTPIEEMHGLGIHLMRKLFDNLVYRREKDSNVLILVMKQREP